jgi:hypothetical protein
MGVKLDILRRLAPVVLVLVLAFLLGNTCTKLKDSEDLVKVLQTKAFKLDNMKSNRSVDTVSTPVISTLYPKSKPVIIKKNFRILKDTTPFYKEVLTSYKDSVIKADIFTITNGDIMDQRLEYDITMSQIIIMDSIILTDTVVSILRNSSIFVGGGLNSMLNPYVGVGVNYKQDLIFNYSYRPYEKTHNIGIFKTIGLRKK